MASTPDRLTQWFSVAAFSTIALVSMTSSFLDGTNITDQEKETKWAVSAVSISLTFSGLAVFANLLLKDKFVDTPIEGGLAVLTAGFWAAVLPAIMDPDNFLAIRGVSAGLGQGVVSTQIFNNNLYFFSWGAFIMSFMILFGYLKKGMALSGDQVVSWGALALTSFVAMVAAIRQYQDWNCDQDDSPDDQCKRTKLAISVGVISGCIGLGWAFLSRWMKGKFGTLIDLVLAWLVFVMWIFGIIYITFGGDKAAARNLNNLYFFTWLSFALSVMMAMRSLTDFFGKEEEDTGDEATMEHKEDVHAPEPEPAQAAVEDPTPVDELKDVDVEATA